MALFSARATLGRRAVLVPSWGVALVLAACSGPTPAGTAATRLPVASPATQKSAEGMAAVSATWVGAPAGPVFTIALDTHSGSIDRYDLRSLAALRVDDGAAVRPASWDAPAGGDHGSGTLGFPATAVAGTPLIGPHAGRVELVIREVGGVPERRCQWQLLA